MELVNELYRYKDLADQNLPLVADAVKKMVLVLSPFVPHICEEMWEHLGGTQSLYNVPWPTYDEKALVKDEVEIVVQINGKIRDKMNVPTGITREEFEKLALESDKIRELLAGKTVVKVVAVPGKLLNIVVK